MTDMEISTSLNCTHCEGRGYVGDAYWDEELEWYIYESNGASCDHCEGSGMNVSALIADTEAQQSAVA